MASVYMGPNRQRWTPSTWQDVVSAAAGGLLNERRWVELKKAIPANTEGANRELAKDLAAMACDGGVIVVGVEDKGHGRAGDVVGTKLSGLQERVDAVAGSLISPPLVVRTVPLDHPNVPDHGCLLVIVDASIDGPHMFEGHYRGRNDTGTRVLSDTEVRRYLFDNAQRLENFGAAFANARAESPLGGPGVMHLFFRPRGGRRGSLTPRLTHSNVLLHEVVRDLPVSNELWALDGVLSHTSRVVRGTQFTDFPPSIASQSRLTERASEVNDFNALRVWDDGTTLMSCSRMIMLIPDAPEGAEAKGLTIPGTMYRTEQAAAIAGRIGDRAGYAGQWDIGMYLDGLQGCHAGVEGYHHRLEGLYGASFPVNSHEELALSTSSELNEAPHVVTRRLLGEVFRVLGAERQVETLRQAAPG